MARAVVVIASILGACASVCASPATAHADDDYDPHSRAWNGLSELVAIAEASGIAIDTPGRLDLGTLRPDDALLVVYPKHEIPVSPLTTFLKAGGRVALADDYGAGTLILDAYHIRRRDPVTTGALRLRGNGELLVARPASSHPLTDGVRALVSNHPQAIQHLELHPIFSLDAQGGALVLAGAVGDGRLVAVSDPSTLINNMLQFRDNRRFAQNLVRYLATGRSGRIVVVTGDTPIVGRFGEPGADRPLHDVRAALEDLAHADLSPAAVRLVTFVLAAILILFGVGTLPRRSPYDGAAMFARPSLAGGFVGRVSFFGGQRGALLQPALAYKFELEGELVRRLGLEGRALLRDVLEALRARGVPDSDVAAIRSLLLELDELRDKQDRPPAPPKVSAAKLHQMLDVGERVLGRLETSTRDTVRRT